MNVLIVKNLENKISEYRMLISNYKFWFLVNYNFKYLREFYI